MENDIADLRKGRREYDWGEANPVCEAVQQGGHETRSPGGDYTPCVDRVMLIKGLLETLARQADAVNDAEVRTMLCKTALVVGLLAFLGLESAQGGEAVDDAFFEARVRPVLVGACVKCHGADKSRGGLRLDSREGMLKGGDTGAALVPGNATESLLVVAIRHDDELLKMPPGKDALSPEAIHDLTTWVSAGAPWPEAIEAKTLSAERHWAFEPLREEEPPADPTGWAESPIDRFIAAQHREKGVTPVEQASRRTLIRRVSFDLIGLPPTPERVEAFVADGRPDAYERLVDELLAMPQYGERWGRYWLDLARYSDTAGDNADYPIPEAYLYRDYVIEALNNDVPYDRFLQEQLAGDILAREGPSEDYARRVIATGFLAQSKRFGTRELEDMHQIIEDTLNTTGQVVLGLSLRCARCHDHKFDPISSKDYYSLYGYFASTEYPFAGAEEVRHQTRFAPLIPPNAVQALEAKHAQQLAEIKERLERAESESADAARLKELAEKRVEVEEQLETADSVSTAALRAQIEDVKAEQEQRKASLEETLKPIRQELANHEKASPLAGVPMAYAVHEGKPTDVAIQIGGDPRKTGEVVSRGVLEVLDPDAELAIPEGSSGRLEFARWLTGPAADLTARVMVNRIWQHHFGKAIVPTPSDFGLRGTPPTHPELLDHLARSFIASGWSIKAMHRQIVLSKTYQLSSRHDQADAEIDSGNTWYWRSERRRLDAEALRDALLALGGNLDSSRPGPHPFPEKDKWRYTAHHQFKALYDSNHRSVYLMVQRLHPHPYLKLFNGPDTSMTTAVRDDSSVPLQALYLLNNPFVHDEATRFAECLIAAEPNRSARLDLAYRQVFARLPEELETQRALRFLESYEQSLESDGMDPGRASGSPGRRWRGPCWRRMSFFSSTDHSELSSPREPARWPENRCAAGLSCTRPPRVQRPSGDWASISA